MFRSKNNTCESPAEWNRNAKLTVGTSVVGDEVGFFHINT